MAPAKSYRAFCGRVDNDPHSSEEERKDFARLVLANFDTTTPNSKNEDQLLEDVLLDAGPGSGMVGGLLTFMETTDEPGGTLQFLHNIYKHTVHGDNRNVSFIYFGDVEDGEVESIPFQKELLAETDEVVVWDSMARLMTQFENDENLGLSGPFGDAALHTKKITTRKCMFVPFSLVPHVIGKDLTPRAAVQVLVPVMAALELDLPQLTGFLLAACTKTTDNHPPVTVQDQTEVGLLHTRPRMFKVANARRAHILHRQLPSLQPGGSDLANSVAAIQNIAISTEGLRTDIAHNTNQRRIDAEGRKRPTTISDRFPHQLDRLLKACDVEVETDLPEVWGQLASRKRDGELVVTMLQTQVTIEATHFGKPATRVTLAHSEALKTFCFIGDGNPANISSGFLPLMFIPPGGTSNEASARQLEIEASIYDYSTVVEGGRGIGLEDSREIRKVKAYLPLDWDEGMSQLYAFLSGFSATHGRQHGVSVEWLKALKLIEHNYTAFKRGFTELYGCRFGIIKLVHYFHLKMHRWFALQWAPTTTESLPSPSFCADLNKWIIDSIASSWIPETRGVPSFREFHRILDIAQGRISAPGPAPLTPTNPNPPGMGRERERERERERRAATNVNNRNRDSRVVGEAPLAKKIRDRGNFAPVIQEMKSKGKPIPQNANGGDHCLSWHLRGKCKTDCVRKADHIAYDRTALEPLFEWCHEAYE